RHIREPIWYLDSGCSTSMTGVKSYLHKYVEQPGLKPLLMVCLFAKASESVNWLWYKRLPYLNFKNINKLAKKNEVLGLPSLVYSKDKPYSISSNTSIDKIRIDDSSRYPPNEFAQEDDPSKQYQANFKFSYYIIPRGRSLSKLTQENHVPEVTTLNEQDNPHTKDVEGPPDPINTEGTQEQIV
ncbi:hypothetical protein Tco_0647419, partial [Tanacetum coccineum]